MNFPGGRPNRCHVMAALVSAAFCFGCAVDRSPAREAEYETVQQAAAGGDIEAVKRFLDEGVPVDDADGSGTPLHNAAAGGHVEMTKFLLESGADVSSRRVWLGDSTPLHIAAGYGHPGVAEVLIKHGADVNALKTLGPISGLTPLHDAVLSRDSHCGHLETARILLESGADVNARAAMGDESLTALGGAEQLGYAELAELIKGYGGVE